MNIAIKPMANSVRWRVYRTSERLHREILKEGHATTWAEAKKAAIEWATNKAGKIRKVVKRTDRPWDWYVYGPETQYHYGRSETKAKAASEANRIAEALSVPTCTS